jgi:hypothetical protein
VEGLTRSTWRAHCTQRDMQHHPRENCIATASFDRTVKLWTHVAQAD